jgi:hypothetical protein
MYPVLGWRKQKGPNRPSVLYENAATTDQNVYGKRVNGNARLESSEEDCKSSTKFVYQEERKSLSTLDFI